MKIETTFEKLRKAKACQGRYRHLAKSLGGIRKYGRTTPITLLQILDNNGIQDALWALRCCETDDEGERLLHEFACWCAEQVLSIYESLCPGDDRPRNGIAAKRAWLRGEITDEELRSAWAAAARAAAWAAYADAAWADTVWADAVWAAAAAARAAACAARVAACAARVAAWAAYDADMREKQAEKLREMMTDSNEVPE